MMKQSWTFNNRITFFLYENVDPTERLPLLKQHVGEVIKLPSGKWVATDSTVSFSLSHSENLFLLAVDPKGQPLGVDLECDRAQDDLELIAKHLYTPAEQEHLASLRGVERRQWALRYWCLKEARFKMCGDSLATFPNEVCLSDQLEDDFVFAVCCLN